MSIGGDAKLTESEAEKLSEPLQTAKAHFPRRPQQRVDGTKRRGGVGQIHGGDL